MTRPPVTAKSQEKAIAKWVKRYTDDPDCEYEPWDHVARFASKGMLIRRAGFTTGRMHVLVSRLEEKAFLALDWLELVTDIREQYPLLPLLDTQAIARAFGVNHPRSRTPRLDVVMTTDLVATLATKDGPDQIAVSVKPSSELRNRRTLEKLAIEYEYWKQRGVEYSIFTEKDCPSAWTRNLKALAGKHELGDESPFADIALRQKSLADLASRIAAGSPLGTTCLAYDEAHGLRDGSSLALVFWALANKVWIADLSKRVDALKPLKILRFGREAAEHP